MEIKKKQLLHYSGWAFQLVILVVIFAWLGKKIDAYLELETPWFALILSLAAIFGSLFMLIRRIIKHG